MDVITHVIWDLGDTIASQPIGGKDLMPLDHYPEVQLRSGVKDTLNVVSSQGYIQAVLSNTAASDSDDIHKLLKWFGVLEFFQFIYATQSELAHDKPEKPDPEAFNIVLSALKAAPEQTVMIGNSWDHDIIGANRSGIHSLWLSNVAVSVRYDSTTCIQCPPWVIPIRDVTDVATAINVLQNALRV